jgi:hypothetical protein
MRKLLWLLALLGFISAAMAGTVSTVPITSGSGTTFQVLSNNAGNLFAEMGICDAAGTPFCATVLSPSTPALTTSLPLVVAISPINSVSVSQSGVWGVSINGTAVVSLSSPNVLISNTPTVSLSSPNIQISNTPTVSLSSPNIQIVGTVPLPSNAAQETGGNLALLATTVSKGSIQTVLSGSATVVQATGTNLHIVCDSGCSSSTAPADEATFTFGTTSQSPVGGVFQTTATSNALTTGQMGAFQVTANRALFVNLRSELGVQEGNALTPLFVTVSPTATVSLSSPNVLVAGVATAANQATEITALTAISASVAGPIPPGAALIGSVSASVTNTVTVSQSSPNIQISNTPTVIVSGATPPNLLGYVTPDPCSQLAKINVNISQNASTQIITGTSAKKTYICSAIILTDNGVANAGQLSLVEGTGAVCATATGALIGGTTSGMALSPSAGFTQGMGLGTVIPVLSASADNVCLLGSVVVHGNMTYVQQ